MFKSRKSKSGKSKKLSQNRNLSKFDTKVVKLNFLTFDTRKLFNSLWLVFIKSLILWYFDPRCHLYIKTDALDYATSEVLNWLTFGTSSNGVVTKTDLGQWYPIAFFLRKMITAKTQYKTNNGKLWGIVKVFKIWHHYLEGYKYKVLVFIDYNNLYSFIDTKNLSFRQVRWVQKFSQYHF